MRKIYFLILLVFCYGFGQDKPVPQSQLMLPDTVKHFSGAESLLPTIQLPEFVILGSAPIEIASAEKSETYPDDLTLSGKSRRREVKPIERTIGKTEFGMSDFTEGKNGCFLITGGRFSSYTAELMHSQPLSNITLKGKGKYYITHGFAPYTNHSGGNIGISASSVTEFPGLWQTATVHGGFEYQTKTYRFYGSDNPDSKRDISGLSFYTNLQNPDNREGWDFSVGINSFVFRDTTNEQRETEFEFTGIVPFYIQQNRFLVQTQLNIASQKLLSFSATIKSQYYEWNRFYFDAALYTVWLQGMNSQNSFYLYPWLTVSTDLLSPHIFYVRYYPYGQFVSLKKMIDINPYATTKILIEHPMITNNAEVGVQSYYSTNLYSNIFVSLQSVKKYPAFYEERTGVWSTNYRNKVTLLTFVGELVAKLTVNDYFSSKILIRNQTRTNGGTIPYIPTYEIQSLWIHSFSSSLKSYVYLWSIGKRNIDVTTSIKLPSFVKIDVRGTYDILNYLRLYAEIQNITNSNYRLWNNYNEEPLKAVVGIQFQW